jgi:hypothetical protein
MDRFTEFGVNGAVPEHSISSQTVHHQLGSFLFSTTYSRGIAIFAVIFGPHRTTAAREFEARTSSAKRAHTERDRSRSSVRPEEATRGVGSLARHTRSRRTPEPMGAEATGARFEDRASAAVSPWPGAANRFDPRTVDAGIPGAQGGPIKRESDIETPNPKAPIFR